MRQARRHIQRGIGGAWLVLWGGIALAAEGPGLPHHQDLPPGPALEPEVARARIEVPPGFEVDLVAAEPDLVNPVAMTFDDQGRVWVTESLEYPRLEAGPGRDRVKVLLDDDRDGRIDRVSVFAEGLNIPSGIAVGHGGVWVANAPDILFLRDDDGDLVADHREVVVTGFGRRDVHELPSALGWGPDGYLYGLNGVFNPSVVRQDDREYRFTCAVWRIEPRSRRFEIFCEGTSNPWGLDWDDDGSAFLSACVIDHLWHVVETGQYERQAGSGPPFAWRQGSIVDHVHQKAAYCGLCYFDSAAYPEEYRGRLYFGNIHGGCLNVDALSRAGAGYRAEARPDFLTARDAWFMPVAQQIGPDGCLWVLDWYDRYHCYQDARRDPAGIERSRGRLYRIRYGERPPGEPFDLARESSPQLVERLASPNRFFRQRAWRLVAERQAAGVADQLARLAVDPTRPRGERRAAMFALVGAGPLAPETFRRWAGDADPTVRAWAVRAAGNHGQPRAEVLAAWRQLGCDPSPEVLLQVAIAAGKLPETDPLASLVNVLARCGDDRVVPAVAWQNLHPLLAQEPARFVELVLAAPADAPAWRDIVPRAIERLVSGNPAAAGEAGRLLASLAASSGPGRSTAAIGWGTLAAARQAGRLTAEHLAALDAHLGPLAETARRTPPDDPLHVPALLWAAAGGSAEAQTELARLVNSSAVPGPARIVALETLLTHRAPGGVELALGCLRSAPTDPAGDIRTGVLTALARLADPAVARELLAQLDQLDPALATTALGLFCERPAWSGELLTALDDGRVGVERLSIVHLQQLATSADDEVRERVRRRFGTIRASRDPARQQTVAALAERLRQWSGRPQAGREVFRRVCVQCHRLYGEGNEVGPDLTSNGRSSWEQLLSNVLDPSLVIGPAYQARTALAADGRVLTGLVVEESAEQITLRLPGGRQEVLLRDELEELTTSELSLMPEGLENQLSLQELADLLALLALDRPPEDPQARKLPGAP